jgi:hypothetical protein
MQLIFFDVSFASTGVHSTSCGLSVSTDVMQHPAGFIEGPSFGIDSRTPVFMGDSKLSLKSAPPSNPNQRLQLDGNDKN